MGDKIRMLIQMVRWLILPLLLTFINTAQAEQKPSCGDRELTIKSLEDNNELLQFRGLSLQFGMMIELFYSQEGHWTLLVTHPDKPDTVCVGDHGGGGSKPPVKKIGIAI